MRTCTSQGAYYIVHPFKFTYAMFVRMTKTIASLQRRVQKLEGK